MNLEKNIKIYLLFIVFFKKNAYNKSTIVIGSFEPGQSRKAAALRNQLCAMAFLLKRRAFARLFY